MFLSEQPAGAINGVNVTFTCSDSPSPATSLRLYLDGVLQVLSTQYSLAGAVITFVTAPPTGSSVFALYQAADPAGGSEITLTFRGMKVYE